MSKVKEQITYLRDNTDMDNRQIRQYLRERGYKVSGRTVRRYAGRWSDRIKERLGLRDESEVEVPEVEQDLPKILVFDIETAPMEAYIWRLWKQTVSERQIIKDWSVLCWSAKWLFDPKIHSAVVTPQDAIDREDARILEPMWDLLDQADIVIAHNGDKFDIKKLNFRFIKAGMIPPMPYRSIDTLKVCRRVFGSSSFKLDYINSQLGLNMKDDAPFSLWKRCAEGNKDALAAMLAYNQNDVLILEDLYVKVRPWIKSHPNVGLFIDTDKEVCTNCGASNLEWRGRYYTPAGRYKAFRCASCNAVGRSRYSDLTKEDRKRLHLSIAS